MPSEDPVQRVRCEFLEMPGLRLTHAQARRLWGLDDAACNRVLQTLIDAQFLLRRGDGTYARTTDGPTALRPAKVEWPPRRSAYRKTS